MAIKIRDKRRCCGCEACVQICHAGAISLETDSEGFLYPVVDREKCDECGMCERVCPVLNIQRPRVPIKIYAAKNSDDKVRENSSSGGIFTLFANDVIARGGVVFGVRFNEQWEVIHSYAETIEGVAEFRGSKYVQSRIGDNFKKAKEFLDAGREVLFSGTPCQIVGLKRYLQREYENLLTIDLICHGVPSPAVWSRFVEELPLAKIDKIKFRDKSDGWRCIQIKIDGCCESIIESVYIKGFLTDIYLRPSCYCCPFKLFKGVSDITLADFWGIENVLPGFEDYLGVSFVILHNQKVVEIYAKFDTQSIEVGMDSFTLKHHNSHFRSAKPHRKRALFFKEFREMDYPISPFVEKLANYWTVPIFWRKVNFNVKRYLKRFRLIK